MRWKIVESDAAYSPNADPEFNAQPIGGGDGFIISNSVEQLNYDRTTVQPAFSDIPSMQIDRTLPVDQGMPESRFKLAQIYAVDDDGNETLMRDLTMTGRVVGANESRGKSTYSCTYRGAVTLLDRWKVRYGVSYPSDWIPRVACTPYALIWKLLLYAQSEGYCLSIRLKWPSDLSHDPNNVLWGINTIMKCDVRAKDSILDVLERMVQQGQCHYSFTEMWDSGNQVRYFELAMYNPETYGRDMTDNFLVEWSRDLTAASQIDDHLLNLPNQVCVAGQWGVNATVSIGVLPEINPWPQMVVEDGYMIYTDASALNLAVARSNQLAVPIKKLELTGMDSSNRRFAIKPPTLWVGDLIRLRTSQGAILTTRVQRLPLSISLNGLKWGWSASIGDLIPRLQLQSSLNQIAGNNTISVPPINGDSDDGQYAWLVANGYR
jgi:hypothetical protein